MTAVTARAPSYLQPRPKAAATSDTSSQSVTAAAAAASTIPHAARPTTPIRLSSRQNALDPLSERATVTLIRRTLCAPTADKSTSIHELLPPLTSSNEVDLQLYALLAIIIREFVLVWYAKITPDTVFVEEVVKVIAHCTRGLEQRLRKVDLEALLLDEVPELLDAHVRAYRTAFYPLHPGPVETDPHTIYHGLCPTPALSPVPDVADPESVAHQEENERLYRDLLVQGILTILLPTEDLENGCLTSLIGQIFAELILGNGLSGKACEPWLLWESMTKILELAQSRSPTGTGRREQSRAKEMTEDTSRIHHESRHGTMLDQGRRSVQTILELVVQYCVLAFGFARFVIIIAASSSSLPSRLSPSVKQTRAKTFASSPQPLALTEVAAPSIHGIPTEPLKRSLLSMKLWSCLANLLDSNTRMPWVYAILCRLQWLATRGPGALGYTNGTLDRLISNAIQTHLLDPSLLPGILRSTRAALFPYNAPAPARITPSPAEQATIRLRCAAAILDAVPPTGQRLFFGVREQQGGTSEADAVDGDAGEGPPSTRERERMLAEILDILDVFGDRYCNKHLVYGLVELLVVRVMPELAERSVSELLAERLG